MTSSAQHPLAADPQDGLAREQLQARDPIFHRLEFGTTREDFGRMMAADFCEVGASGNGHSRQRVLQVLESRHAHGGPTHDPWRILDFECRRLAEHVYLAPYTLFRNERKTRRSTIWPRTAEGWKIRFHEGTRAGD